MMNSQTTKNFPVIRRFQAVLLALVLLATAARAEAPRWLFVFDTSSDMKKRLPAVESEIKTLFESDFEKSLKEGDSIGVWTFGQKLEMGKFPLISWEPWEVGPLVTNLTKFIHKQSYTGNTSFNTLQPTLNSVIDDSERLTVVIFCDGEDEIHWTPYDEGINETMKQTRDARAKMKEPFILILRTQLGKYIGATVNFPPMPTTLTPFPLLPREIKALPPPPAPVVEASRPVIVVPAPALVIVGTHVSSDTNDVTRFLATNNVPVPPVPVAPPVAAEKPMVSNVPVASVTAMPPPVPPAMVTPSTVMPASTVPQTKPVPVPAVPVPAPAPAQPEKVIASAPPVTAAKADDDTKTAVDDRDTRILTYVGVGLFGAAVVLVIFLITRGRSGPESSLITSSMHNDPRPPGKK